jgi:hypothetical protein
MAFNFLFTMMAWLSHLVLLLPTALLARSLPGSSSPAPLIVQNDVAELYHDVKVPVTLAVMSQCPDAILVERVFDHVLDSVMNRVELQLIYVAQINSSEREFGVTCKHGPVECAGNVQQLCAAKYEELNRWWSFVHCQNYYARDEIGTPAVALKCAKIANIDWENGETGQCAGKDGSGKGAEGILLLQKSVRTTKVLGITRSCTILINGRRVCVHDEIWKECEAGHTPSDFIRQINTEYERINGYDDFNE